MQSTQTNHINELCDIAVEISAHSDRLTQAVKAVLVPSYRSATEADVAKARRIKRAFAEATDKLIAQIDIRDLAKRIAERSNEAYSFNRYADWEECAEDILGLGFSEIETEVILRSKWMRWAADIDGGEYGKVKSVAIVRCLQIPGLLFAKTQGAEFDLRLAELVASTFPGTVEGLD